MEKRFLLFIFLSLVILTVYQSLVVKPVPKPVPGATAASGATGPAAARASTPASPTTASPAPALAAPIVHPAPPPAEMAALVGEPSERDVTVETENAIAVFPNPA